MKHLLLLLLAAFILCTSCATKKSIIYFQDAETIEGQPIPKTFEPLVETSDILYITISSPSDEVVRPFKRNESADGRGGTANPALQGYLVNKDGEINFPYLGAFSVSGKTRNEVVNELTLELNKYIKDFVVDVRIINFKVTVLGQVFSPGVYTIDNERVTLPEAIALAGDFTTDGKRVDVTVIREENGKRKVGKIDFTSTDFFDSEFYYLKQNDVVYVEPSLKGVKKSGFIPDVPALLSLVTIVLSTVIILTR